jgi:uncharacterized protein (DUF302 family)
MYRAKGMKKIIFALVATLVLAGCADKTRNATSKFIKVYESNTNISNTKKAIVENLSKKNYKLTYEYNHEKDAIALKKMLYPTLTIELNNPKISTKLISCNPTMAQDLPIRVALFNKINGQTYISYTDPEYWSLKHNITDATCLNLVLVIKEDLREAVESLEKKSK